jgi:hypothetical protein
VSPSPTRSPRLAPRTLERRQRLASLPVRAASRILAARGLAPAEAGNLTAFLHGLAPTTRGWTADEIERLLFLRYRVERQSHAS